MSRRGEVIAPRLFYTSPHTFSPDQIDEEVNRSQHFKSYRVTKISIYYSHHLYHSQRAYPKGIIFRHCQSHQRPMTAKKANARELRYDVLPVKTPFSIALQQRQDRADLRLRVAHIRHTPRS